MTDERRITDEAAEAWRRFQDAGLLWWVNRLLHTFGWAVVLTIEEDGRVVDARPERVRYLGFSPEVDEDRCGAFARHVREDGRRDLG